MTQENRLREEIVALGASLFERGLTHGSTGNISVKLDDGVLLTPTGSSLGRLDPARIAKLDARGALLAGDPPSKEAFLHLAMYEERGSAGAVVHLHSVHAVAVSVLEAVDARNVLAPLTAYYAMWIGTLPLVPYFAPGDRAPDRRAELLDLRDRLRRAVETENFELAAELRDRIRVLE